MMSVVILILIALLAILTDIYTYRIFHFYSNYLNKKLSNTLIKKAKILYFFFSFVVIGFSVFYVIYNKYSDKPDPIKYRDYMLVSSLFMLFYVPKLIILAFSIIEFIINFIIVKLIGRLLKKEIMLLKFRPITLIGIILSFFFLTNAAYGIVLNRCRIVLEKVEIAFSDLPKSFDGFKIIQISDLHLGSFTDTCLLSKSVNLINETKPDIIVFTGDMVNNLADEAIPYVEILGRLKAKYGKYAVLGNHDMGDYRRWGTIEEKQTDVNRLIKAGRDMGFDWLLNENRIIKANGDSIALLGIDSWGLPPFKKYGDLKKAMTGVEKVDFKLLLSHNPTHFNEEVLAKTDINLMLAGHTHAFQIGLKLFGGYWSPFMFMYQYWCGLYENAGQYIYVNRGLGYLGFRGRIGMAGEITLITLKHKS